MSVNGRSHPVLTGTGLGTAILDRMEALDMPRKVFVRRVGMSNGYLTQIVKGQKMPSLPMLIDVATVLDMPTSRLLAEAEKT